VRGGVGNGTCRRLLPSLAKAGITQHDSAAAWRRHDKALLDDRDLGSKARSHRG
jgi:predicted flap endonuclease-1-like 5' DNA nuclease